MSTAATPIVFSSDVAANSFGLVFPITSPIFNTGVPPVMVFDSERNQVILGHDFPSPFILPPRIGVVNLTTGKFTMTKGRGLGEINGMAVDSVDGVLCTTTSFDSAVQFYDLIAKTAFSEHLPGGGMNSLGSGLEVAFDPMNKLFLIAQPFSGTASSGSSIQVYNTAGTLLESIDGLNFQGGFNVFPIHITLNPSQRLGYVDGPDLTTAIQSFNY